MLVENKASVEHHEARFPRRGNLLVKGIDVVVSFGLYKLVEEKSTEVTRYSETLQALVSHWNTKGAFWQSRCSHSSQTLFCFGTVLGGGYWEGFSPWPIWLFWRLGVLNSLPAYPGSQILWYHLPVLLSHGNSICSSWEWLRNRRLSTRTTDLVCNSVAWPKKKKKINLVISATEPVLGADLRPCCSGADAVTSFVVQCCFSTADDIKFPRETYTPFLSCYPTRDDAKERPWSVSLWDLPFLQTDSK